MEYIGVLLLLIGTLLVYFRIANHFNIIDKPNHRSAHTEVTLRGGGIVFPVALVLFIVIHHSVPQIQIFPFVMGMLALATVSFWDDVQSLPNKVRLLVHLISVSLLLWSIGIFEMFPWFIIALLFILVIGTLNAYNFMDGINGITGLYSLVILTSLWYYSTYVNSFVETSLIMYSIAACLAFLFFNFRKRAKCFAGDIGSMSIAYWVIGLLGLLILKEEELKFVLFLAVYGVETVITIIQRLILRQNIFKAHRLHLYQMLVHEYKFPHTMVSSLYASIQLLINVLVIFWEGNSITLVVGVLSLLVLIYTLVKYKLYIKTIQRAK
ncbi:MraY family glycosyltransferase [Imtechella halotolerans]|uniref:Glycosyl transferase, family 4 n=1 Tax=Imtechella halotolerans K1 TaxID=946077 RepID=I0W5K7_9FLAO|nr:glycosyltransferase family 4 protein [Imtechella halotolerans]EID71673.1 glycosyl transferase, family 4 [Imtechella halotolerans K1]WMQ64007.1 glycosyltransferase family 4 protein [Imtechella halotolerans]